MSFVGLALGMLIGVALGLMGGGGSILTVPIFVYIMGIEPKSAIAMSLAVVGATSLFGAIGHWRAGNINVRIASIFAPVAMLGTFAGAKLSVFMSGQAQLMLFAVVMLFAAFFMLRDRSKETPEASHYGDKLPIPLIALEGIAVGVLTGLVGVGGGFLIVPALVLLGKVPMKQAVGTSLVVIAFKSLAGFTGYLGQVPVDWAFMGVFVAVAAIGTLIGTQLVKLFSQARLKQSFAVFLLVMGGFIFYQNRAMLGIDVSMKAASQTISGH